MKPAGVSSGARLCMGVNWAGHSKSFYCRKNLNMAEEATLDEEFKRIVAEMKPYARLLPQKSEERHKVTLWIKKLLGLKIQRRERNEYARVLLQMLKEGKLEAPFVESPPVGPLRMPETHHPPPRPHSPNDLDSLLMSSPEETRPAYTTTAFDSSHHQQQHSRTNEASSRSASSGIPVRKGHQTSKYKTSSSASSLQTGTNLTQSELGRHLDSSSQSRRVGSSLSTAGTKVPFSGTGSGRLAQHDNWRRELFSSSAPDSSFQPKLTSTLAASQGGSKYHPKLTLHLSEDSLELNEDLLEHSFNLSDEGSPDGDISDVAALLQNQPKPRTRLPAAHTARSSHFSSTSSYTPKVSFASSLPHSTGSPKKLDVSRELLHAREVELKVKSAETRFQEEKLRIQRHHEDSLKQILDRKNNELEELRLENRTRVHQLETQNKRLQRKVSQLERECRSLLEEKEAHLSEARASSQHTRHSLQADFDKKLHSAISDFEREKLELEQRHSKHLQKVLDETSSRISKMEGEYSAQARANSEVISELEGRVTELIREAESRAQAHSRLAQEKVTLERKCASLESKLQEAKEKVAQLEHECGAVREEGEGQARQLRAKLEQTVKELRHQHSLQEAKTVERLTHVEQEASRWQQALEETRRRHQGHINEVESIHQKELKDKEMHYQKMLAALKTEQKKRELEAKEKQLRLESSLRECEEQLVQLRSAQELQSQQAEQAIEDFKTQVEQQTSEMFDQMRGELERMERDLVRSRALREKQAKEFGRQRGEERRRSEKELAELRLWCEQEKSQLRRDHQTEVEALRREQERTKESALARLSSSLADIEAQAQAKATHDAKVISSLEAQVQELSSQLEQSRAQHTRELSSVRERAEEEKQTALRIHESAISKLKTQLESQRLKLRQDHQKEMHTQTEKQQHRIQQLEHDFASRTAQTAETVTSLQTQVKFLQQDLERQQKSYEDQMSELTQRNKEERASLKHHHNSIAKGLQQEADAAHTTVRQLEERTRHLQIESEAKLSHLRLQYETRMKGMMPATVKQEYEDTIHSLKAQVRLLTQRATVLQEDLERKRPSLSGRPSSHFRSPSKITAISNETV